MKLRESLLGGSAAMPGASLQRACRLLVAVCALHLGVTLVYYLAGRDLSRLPQLVGVSTSLQGGSNGAAAIGQPSRELRPPGAPPPLPWGASFQPRPGRDSSPDADSRPGPARNLTLAALSPGTAVSLPACPEESPLLVGPMMIEFNMAVDLNRVAEENPEVKLGGRYTPKDCISPHKVAIIIPFRNRQEHLKYWLYYLHPILQRQQLDYGIYVINQAGEAMFNRAKLLNVGFQEALKDYDYNCFVFSDVDLIPMNDHNAYRCFSQPRHISVAMDKFGFSLPYVQYFGGVSALSKEQFLTINGFPNNYWGWGGEDDDIFNRLVFKGMSLSRPNAVIGKCRMIRHSRDKKNEPNPQSLYVGRLPQHGCQAVPCPHPGSEPANPGPPRSGTCELNRCATWPAPV
uniref:Beta-1,4-galactosyltransferase n=1 Tax=Equus caballus TaxID=9796 RepID=A0A9L0SQ92_HORSE